MKKVSELKAGGIPAKSHLVANVKRDWKRNATIERHAVKDDRNYFRAITKDLILPLYLDRLAKACAKREIPIPQECLEKDDIDRATNELSYVVCV